MTESFNGRLLVLSVHLAALPMCVLIAAVFWTAIGLAIFGLAIFALLRHLRPLKRLRDSRLMRRSADRHRIRVAFTSVWANALGLGLIAAVIFLVGASHLGFEIWRHYSGESAPLSTARLEELLEKRLPDPELQKQQHREMVNAIQSRKPSDTILVPSDKEAIKAELSKLEPIVANLERAAKERFTNVEVLGSLAKWILWSLAGAGVVLFVRSFFATSLSRRVLEIAAAGALMVPSIFGGLKLANDLKTDFTAIKDMGGIHFNLQWGESQPPTPKPTEPRDVDVYLHLDVGRGQDSLPATMDCGEGDKQRVGPFDGGDVTLTATTATMSGEAVAKELLKRAGAKPERLSAIILIGSADKRSLKPQTAALYSSNAGLAQARIGVVKDALKSFFEKEEAFKKSMPQMLAFYAGPTMTGAKLPIAGLSKDRTVQVCVLWDHKP
jgi:hypothetical protein